MTDYFYLVPIALALGLAAFMWTLRNGQYDDLDGAAERILLDGSDKPITARRQTPSHHSTENPKAADSAG